MVQYSRYVNYVCANPFFPINFSLAFHEEKSEEGCFMWIHALSEEAASEFVTLILNLRKGCACKELGLWRFWSPKDAESSLLGNHAAVKVCQIPKVSLQDFARFRLIYPQC